MSEEGKNKLYLSGTHFHLQKCVTAIDNVKQMIGIPTQPQLLLSQGLYTTFTADEIEYVLMHEAGHYVLQHGVMELMIGIMLLADAFALRHITNPQGMISATHKLQAFYEPPGTTKSRLFTVVFYRRNPYAQRIKMAERAIINQLN